jgi:hypothetical protein
VKIQRLKRRMFLHGAGGALLALPWLPSLAPREVQAQTSGAPRRFVAIKSYSTQNIRDFYPSRAVSGYTLRDYGGDESGGGNGKEDGTLALSRQLAESSGRHSNGNAYTGSWAPLADFADGGISNILSEDLAPFYDKMLLLRGLDYLPDTNHNDGGILGNYAGGSISDQASSLREFQTIDQVLAYSSKFYPTVPRGTRSLHLSPGRSNTFSYTRSGNASGSIEQMNADTNPRAVFDRLFQDFTGEAPTPGVNPNLALIDRVIEDYRSVRESSRLSRADKDALEQHVSFMTELQARLEAPPVSGCTAPTAPPSVPNQGVSVSTLRESYGLMIDLLVAAIRCDLTRIVTLDVYKAIGMSGGDEAGFEHSCASCEGSPNPTDWHRAAHDWDQLDQRAKVISINEWIAREVFKPILEKLDVDQGDGTSYLDSSVVLWGNELGMNHLNYSVPTVLAGSAGGYLKTGRYIDYIDWNRSVKFSQHNGMVIEGVPYNRLLVTLLQAYGLEPEDYEEEAGEGYGDISTAGKPSDAFAVDYDFGQVGNVLPDIKA